MDDTIVLAFDPADPRSRRAAALLQEVGAARPVRACCVCSSLVSPDALAPNDALGGEACSVCAETAARVLAQFDGDAARGRAEVIGQLPRYVRDVVGGAEFPHFYKGFE